ncbi:MAG: hypothetical protein ACOYUZ_01250 [Patescibacteria group bacterium]
MAKRTALISVFHKQGIVEFCEKLVELDFELIASGGTAKHLKDAGLVVRDVAELVGGDAILGHRVVTLSREIHAGLMARDTAEDRAELERLGIPWIDLVCVDLYPLEEEIAKPEATMQSVLEKTDVGGPSMLRSAAKGRRIVVCDPADRISVLQVIVFEQDNDPEFRDLLAAKAEYVCARYSLASARFIGGGKFDGMIGSQVRELKYGENAHQAPAYHFVADDADPLALHRFELVHGDRPGYVNTCDMDRLVITAVHIAAQFEKAGKELPHLALAVKHGNVCGACYAATKEEAIRGMIEGEPQDIFGGFILTTFPIRKEHAELLVKYLHHAKGKRVISGILAPGFANEAKEILTFKVSNCCLFANHALADLGAKDLDRERILRRVRGGFLMQPNYLSVPDPEDPQIQKVGPCEYGFEDILLAMAIGRTANSNTIVLTKAGKLIGAGIGQKSRVRAAKLAIDIARGAGHDVSGAIAYSDSFFPFSDGPAVLAEAGVAFIFSSSGSVRDQDTSELCKSAGVTLWLYPDKLGRGFFGH